MVQLNSAWQPKPVIPLKCRAYRPGSVGLQPMDGEVESPDDGYYAISVILADPSTKHDLKYEQFGRRRGQYVER